VSWDRTMRDIRCMARRFLLGDRRSPWFSRSMPVTHITEKYYVNSQPQHPPSFSP
jgi:hypothetical protein